MVYGQEQCRYLGDAFIERVDFYHGLVFMEVITSGDPQSNGRNVASQKYGYSGFAGFAKDFYIQAVEDF